MKVLIQRVLEASVTVEGNLIGKIDHGILAFIGIEKDDNEKNATNLAQKLLNYRIFADDNDKMNNNVQQANGGILVVSQFTLAANTCKGLRPSFSSSAPPDEAHKLYLFFISQLQNQYPHIETGKFGADMKVSLINDGPVTFLLEN